MINRHRLTLIVKTQTKSNMGLTGPGTRHAQSISMSNERHSYQITSSGLAVVRMILTFVGPCIVKYFYSKTNQMHNIYNLFYFGTTLHVSDGLSVHHQESKTVHTASGICHTGSVAAC